MQPQRVSGPLALPLRLVLDQAFSRSPNARWDSNVSSETDMDLLAIDQCSTPHWGAEALSELCSRSVGENRFAGVLPRWPRSQTALRNITRSVTRALSAVGRRCVRRVSLAIVGHARPTQAASLRALSHQSLFELSFCEHYSRSQLETGGREGVIELNFAFFELRMG